MPTYLKKSIYMLGRKYILIGQKAYTCKSKSTGEFWWFICGTKRL